MKKKITIVILLNFFIMAISFSQTKPPAKKPVAAKPATAATAKPAEKTGNGELTKKNASVLSAYLGNLVKMMNHHVAFMNEARHSVTVAEEQYGKYGGSSPASISTINAEELVYDHGNKPTNPVDLLGSDKAAFQQLSTNIEKAFNSFKPKFDELVKYDEAFGGEKDKGKKAIELINSMKPDMEAFSTAYDQLGDKLDLWQDKVFLVQLKGYKWEKYVLNMHNNLNQAKKILDQILQYDKKSNDNFSEIIKLYNTFKSESKANAEMNLGKFEEDNLSSYYLNFYSQAESFRNSFESGDDRLRSGDITPNNFKETTIQYYNEMIDAFNHFLKMTSEEE